MKYFHGGDMPFISRSEPYYALCGLNCCLCPRFNTDGISKCPGCGGPGFPEKHPSCAVMGCSIKHGSIDYCCDCSDYPCKKYEKPSEKDSFASYCKVIENFKESKKDRQKYLRELEGKYAFLQKLLKEYNDGRLKNFYCIVVNNMGYEDLSKLMETIQNNNELNDFYDKEKAKQAAKIIKKRAEELGVICELRK